MAGAEFEEDEHEGGGESTCRAEDVLPRRSELRTSEDVMHPNPKIRAGEEGPAWAAGEEPPSGPSAAEVAVAAEDMRRCMQEFGVDLATVTQAFLKNSGEVAAAECCLRTGQRSDSCPLWDRQDDLDLQAGGDLLRARLVTKYGAENVNRRVAFRNS
ncbi:hypothetical protein lerEdw1_011480 [Lerista edwardsae]|nr:hypothetical protein lerEdw1_011480 [Lerista edwardsae]